MTASVIIATYKRPVFLIRAVESVLAQSLSAEVIVVDDNGKGSALQIQTEEVLKPFLGQIVYLPLEKNSGACIARNQGIAIAKGKYIFFLDDDDEFLPNKVETQVGYLADHPEYDGCLSAFIRRDDHGKQIVANSNFPVTESFANFVVSGNFFTPMLCIRKSSFEKSGEFRDIPRFQDRYFMLHCLLQGMTFADLQEPLHIMYEHSGERVTHQNVDKSLQALDLIENLINANCELLSEEENVRFMENSMRMKAMVLYVAGSRNTATRRWWELFRKTWAFRDLKMVLKSFIKM